MIRKIIKLFDGSNESKWFQKQIYNNNNSTTIYVGNLSFKIREEKIWEYFTQMGEIKRVITGINRFDLSKCGFVFIDFCHPKITIKCFLNSNGLKLNQRTIRIDLDSGFKEGRQFGRGKRGGQLLEDKEMFKKKHKFFKKKV